MLRKILLGFSFIIPAFFNAQAQDECELALNRATEEFDAGHLQSIPSILGKCLEKNQNREWRQRAFLLLSETYLLLEDPFGAEKSYLEVLRANPEFIADEKRDPIDLVYLSSKFTATPIFTLFAHTGSNISIIRTILDRDPSGTPQQRNLIRPGFQLGAGGDWNYNDNLSLTLEGNYVFSSYKQRTTDIYGRDLREVLDKQSWLKVPISVKYASSVGKFRPYGYFGLSVDLILADRITVRYLDQDINPTADTPGETTSKEKESPVIKISPKRNFLNRSMFMGGGVKYKVNLDYIFVDLRYSFGLTNLVDEENRFYNYRKVSDKTSKEFQDTGDLFTRYAYVDDFFRMDNLYLSIGYIHPLYKPRKLKKAKSKAVLRTIKKQDDASPKD